jgi:hypothetical protein
MLRHWASPSDYDVFYSAYKAYEISGPGEHFMLAVSSLLLVAYVVVVGACWWRVARMGRALTPDALVWSTLTLTLGFLCVSKVLSPQYLLWLTPTACVGLAVVTRVRPMLRWVGILAVAVGLSHLLYPALYTALALPERDTWIAMVVLTARNVLLLALLVLAAVEAWRATRPVEVGDEASAVGGEEQQPDGRARLGTS